jgi:hypothetical protein
MVLFDCVPYIKVIMDYYRTYTESGKPCTGAAYDYMNEQVDLIKFTPIIPACDGTNAFPLLAVEFEVPSWRTQGYAHRH